MKSNPPKKTTAVPAPSTNKRTDNGTGSEPKKSNHPSKEGESHRVLPQRTMRQRFFRHTDVIATSHLQIFLIGFTPRHKISIVVVFRWTIIGLIVLIDVAEVPFSMIKIDTFTIDVSLKKFVCTLDFSTLIIFELWHSNPPPPPFFLYPYLSNLT